MAEKEMYHLDLVIGIKGDEETKSKLSAMDKFVDRTEKRAKMLDKMNMSPAVQINDRITGPSKKITSTLDKIGRTKATAQTKLIDKVSGPAQKITSGLNKIKNTVWTATVSIKDKTTSIFGKIKNGLGSLFKSATSLQGLLLGLGGTWAGVVKPMQISGDFEQTQIGFKTMLHSAEAANTFLDQAQDMANKTPFEFPELANSSKKLLAFGWNVKDILSDLTIIGDTSSGLGLGAEGINQITLALGQMKAKGRVQGDEILQLTEAGVPAAKILQEQLGLTAEQVGNIGKLGVDSDKAIRALLTGMNQRFGGMMKEQSKTALGLMSTLKDTFSNKILKEWGTGLWNGVKPALLKVTDWLDKNDNKVKELGNTLKKAGENVSKWIVGGLEKVGSKINSLVNSSEWKNATTLGSKFKLAWDKIIEEPFASWWSGKGQSWVTKTAENMGKGLGGALGGFLMSALGVVSDPKKGMKESPFVSAGSTAGAAFLNAFLDAFDAEKIAEKAVSSFGNKQKNLEKFLPRGKSPDIGSWATLGLDAFLLYKGGKGLFKAGQGGKSVLNFFKGGKGAKKATTTATEVVKSAPNIVTEEPRTVKIFGANGDVLSTVSKATSGGAGSAAETAVGVSKSVGKVGKFSEWLGIPAIKEGLGQAGKALKETKAAEWIGKLGELGIGGKFLKGIGKVGEVTKGKGIPIIGTTIAVVGSAAEIADASPKERGKVIAGEAGGWTGSIAGGAAAGALVGTLGGGPVGTAIGGTIGGIGGAIGGEKFTKWVYDKKDSIAKWGTNVGKQFDSSLTSVKASAKQTGAEIATHFNNAKTKVQNKWSNTKTWFNEKVGTPLKNGAIDATNITVGALSLGKDAAVKAWAPYGAWFNQNVSAPVKAGASAAGSWIDKKYSEAKTNVNNAWMSVGNWFNTNVSTPVETAATEAGLWMGQKYSEAHTWVQNAWTGIGNWWETNVSTPVRTGTAQAGSWISQKYSEAKQGAATAWSDFSTWWTTNVSTPVETAATEAGSWIGDRLKDARATADKAWSGFSTWFKSNISGPVDDFIEKARKRGEEKTNLKIPKQANGGITTGPQLSIIGEAGPEAIIPLSGNRRSRGLSLWQQTGRMLGVGMYANGGIVGNISKDRLLSSITNIPQNRELNNEKPIYYTSQPQVALSSEYGPINIDVENNFENDMDIDEIVKRATAKFASEFTQTLKNIKRK